MKIILAGGGTGGHIMPNLALYQYLKHDNHQFLYVGSKKGMEREIVPKEGLNFKGISCGKMRRYFDWENFVDVFRTIWGIVESFLIIQNFKPDVIFCKGGYVSFPVAVAGWLQGRRVILHESDVVPGLANRLTARFAAVICVSFEKTKAYFGTKAVLTGNPVRAEIASGSKEQAMKLTGLSGKKPVVLVVGGSQGAQKINEAVWEKLEVLLNQYEIIHLCGKGKLPAKKIDYKGYFVQEYASEEMKDFLALAEIVLTRAGANALAEIEFLGKKAVLVPLKSGSRGDQIDNAAEFAKQNPAIVVDEDQIDLEKILGECNNLPRMEKAGNVSQAVEKIAKILL